MMNHEEHMTKITKFDLKLQFQRQLYQIIVIHIQFLNEI